jgi:ribose 5-phosphate isomerase A
MLQPLRFFLKVSYLPAGRQVEILPHPPMSAASGAEFAMLNMNELKKQAAERAVDCVESGMVVGLGTGSTAVFAVYKIAELLKAGKLKNVTGIPSSFATEKEARRKGIPLTTFDQHPEIDLTIDGADEVDPDLNLIKGGGGALLREKILAQASQRTIIVIDESKLSVQLGSGRPVPVEVVRFALQPEMQFIKSLGAGVALRRTTEGGPFITDEENYIIDCDFGPLSDPRKLAQMLDRRAGIVEHGLFLGLASEVTVAGRAGVRILKRETL